VRVIEYWNWLPREIVKSSTLKPLRIQLDAALRNQLYLALL